MKVLKIFKHILQAKSIAANKKGKVPPECIQTWKSEAKSLFILDHRKIVYITSRYTSEMQTVKHIFKMGFKMLNIHSE